MPTTPELLAPAGEPESGYAALHYGADAVYLGLNRFSARAEAVNFTPQQLGEFAAYAHSLSPRRGVYLTLNTVIRQDELPGAAETLLVAAECGVDAVIVQDLGAATLVKERFPGFELHASTQMAIHSLEGVLAAGRLGFDRVTLARELTLGEIARIAAESGMELETFIHGTLCYGYSGLCLFSSLAASRSGNRGRCVYSCREAATTPNGRVHPFSLKDMALGERVLDLVRAGVKSLKIEGRKKSPLYVAATVDYYRRILDGKLTAEAAAETEAGLKTIFARPWTRLFLDGRHNPDAADPDVVGHRGSRIGEVEGIVDTPAGPAAAFRPAMAVERHDGLQVDIPGQARPYGFPVDNLYVIKGRRLDSAFAAPAGSKLAVALPEDAPSMRPGLPLYLSSSQAVKRAYPYSKPKSGAFGQRLPVRAEVSLAAVGDGTSCRVSCLVEAETPSFLRDAAPAEPGGTLSFRLDAEAPAFPARDGEGAEKAARTAFERMGGEIFRLEEWRFDNPGALYVRPGDWNRIRREALAGLTVEYEQRLGRVREALAGEVSAGPGESAGRRDDDDGFIWSVFAEDAAFLSAFTEDDFHRCGEVVVGVAGTWNDDSAERLTQLVQKAGREKIRLAPPPLTREAETGALRRVIDGLWREGWRRWLVSGLAGWQMLSGRDGADLTADWTLYVLNRMSADRLLAMGFTHFTLSPEDGAGNLAALLRSHAEPAWLVAYSDLPLFISAACAHAHIGRCRLKARHGSARCPESGDPLRLVMERSGVVEIWPQGCGSVVVGERPYSLAGKLGELRSLGAKRLRVDLRWKRYLPEAALAAWRNTVSGISAGAVVGNFERGLL